MEQTLAGGAGRPQLIDAAEHLGLLVEPDLSVLIFERIGWERRRLHRWSARALAPGFAFVTPTRHAGQVCTRFAIVNPQTTPDDLSQIIDSMR